MAFIYRNWRIPAALVFAVTLVTIAYLAALGTLAPGHATASTETALLQAIATRDSDGDSLPDWEEALYGTDPNIVDTRGLGMPDGEAVSRGIIVPRAAAEIRNATSTQSGSSAAAYGLTSPAPGSLTELFAQHFFMLYVDAKKGKGGVPLTEEETSAIAKQAVNQLAGSVSPVADFKKRSDLSVTNGGAEELRAFAGKVEAVLVANKSNASKSELLYLEEYLKTTDASVFPNILSIAQAYEASAAGLAALPVPQELANEYLKFINAMARVGAIARDFSRVETDPLATMLALTQYPETVLELGNALIQINVLYAKHGILLQPGEPGASFVNIIPDIAESQKITPEL